MLGERIDDPNGVEGGIREIRGLGFLPTRTTLTNEKELSRISGETLSLPFVESGARFNGYEIHIGDTPRTTSDTEKKAGTAPLLVTDRGGRRVREFRGSMSKGGLVIGCYAHGFFDAESIRIPLTRWLAERSPNKKNIAGTFFDPTAERERSFNLLAEHLAKAADTLLSHAD